MLRFHGGEGATLEVRIFSHTALLQQLRAAGFNEITDWKDRVPAIRCLLAGAPLVPHFNGSPPS